MPHRPFLSLLSITVLTIMLLVPGPAAMAARLYTNTNPLFEACLQRCEEQTPLGALTKRGCYKGCAEIRRVAPIKESYRSMASCIEDMNELELEKDLVIEKYQAWCDKQTPHIHKRKGCRDAMEVYMRAATVTSICYHQQPREVAKQTPRTPMTTRYPAVTTYPPGQPAPHSTAYPTSSPGYASDYSGSYSGNQYGGNALAMPPVYDTPKYRQGSSSPTSKTVKQSTRSTGTAVAPAARKVTTSQAPSLTPPKSAGTIPPSKTRKNTQATKPVPVITPSTAIKSAQGAKVSTEAHQSNVTPLNAGAVPSPPSTPQSVSSSGADTVPPAPAAVTTGQSTSPQGDAPKAGQGTGSDTPAPYAVNTTPPQTAAQGTPSPTPVINPAATPTVPPVIAPPAPIMPDFTGTPPPASLQTSRPAPQPLVTKSTPDLLPALQQPVSTSRPAPANSQFQQNQGTASHGVDSPMPAPIPDPSF